MKFPTLCGSWAQALFAGFLFWYSGPPIAMEARGEEPKNLVLEKAESVVAALRAAGVTLTDADFEIAKNDAVPDLVVAAGPEFVASWREYRRAVSLKKPLQPQQPESGKNVFEGRAEYDRLVNELLYGEKSPTPEQLAQFFYSDHGFCATGSMTFGSANDEAILLACLRHRRFGEAVQMLFASSGLENLRTDLLSALGFDWRRVVAGAWLDGKNGLLASLCKSGSEEVALLTLRWAELHWDEAVAMRAKEKRENFFRGISGPQLPALELLYLLVPGNTVTEATKERIAAFLRDNATRLYDVGDWLRRPPEGTAQWLKPIARAALRDARNDVRLMGEKVLRDAGEADAKAELRPSARYRLFVNGELWRSVGFPHPGLSVTHGPGARYNGLATDANPNSEGIIVPNPDDFTPPELLREAHFYVMPSTVDKPTSPAEPWIRAEIPLPPAFGQTTDIRVETVGVTVQPRFPRPAKDYGGAVSEVGFGWAEEGQQPEACARVYHLIGGGPLVLAKVQPGEYWLRVRAPGAALGQWEKISISKAMTRFEPRLDVGATVTVPLRWPETLKLEELDPEIADLFRSSWWAGLPAFFTIEREGKDFPADLKGPVEMPADSISRFLSLRNLPVGKYRVQLRSSVEIRADRYRIPQSEQHYSGWKANELSFEVTDRSSREFTTPPLKIKADP